MPRRPRPLVAHSSSPRLCRIRDWLRCCARKSRRTRWARRFVIPLQLPQRRTDAMLNLRSTWIVGLVCLLLALTTLWVYLPVRHHDFVTFDDPEYVTENHMV